MRFITLSFLIKCLVSFSVAQAQSHEAYVSGLSKGGLGILSIPLTGQPSPEDSEEYVIPNSIYNDAQSIEFMKNNILKQRSNTNDISGQWIPIRAYFNKDFKTGHGYFYGHSVCKVYSTVEDIQGDRVLDGGYYVPSKIELSKNRYPVYIDKNQQQERYEYFQSFGFPISAEFFITVHAVPHELCDEILNYWGKCERIDLEFKLKSPPFTKDVVHGVDSANGVLKSEKYSFDYLAHRVVCDS